jgi:hypothetical protein
MSERVRSLLLAELELASDDLYVARELIDPGSLWEIHALDRADAKLPTHVPGDAARVRRRPDGSVDLFAAIREQDVLVHHPYESFGDSTEAFLAQAAEDPAVLAIKHTLYRTSGVENTLVRNLIEAAEAGKQVVTLVELTARFDEQANIKLARVLEEAGVHVVYGVVGLKSHCKVTLGRPRGSRAGSGATCTSAPETTTRRLRARTKTSGCSAAPTRSPPTRGAVQLPDRLQQAGRLSQAGRRAGLAAREAGSRRSSASEARAQRADRDQGETASPTAADRRALRGVAGGRRDRSDRARCVLPAPGRAGAVRDDPRALDRRVRSSSTRASTGSGAAASRAATSARPT